MVRLLCCFLQLLSCCFVQAQKNIHIIDSVAARMATYSAATSSTTFFVHYDKNVYTPYENVWFRAYLVKSNVAFPFYHTLAVSLIDNETRRVWIAEQFIMQNGLASGNLFLPDSLPAGKYSFIAYTNRITNDYPDDVFIQPITIKTAQRNLRASLQIDTTSKHTDSVRLILKATLKDLAIVWEMLYTPLF